ncbi:nucleotidyltransferase domain-containing protein [Alkalimonas amylolytica]|uniref:Nucleotidyltransferase domain-containing protein n=1 Tax=Alkalimonas amylolytica TaxID=152573 RepID=A0A1H4A3K8_ALKAM|nr:nucleotidyltransferase domain-containing protein [Alkalimonas amylolytica]SEA30112.1 Nucleotidyltransferase domain-containing protein [Alkalimonas amylolytica]
MNFGLPADTVQRMQQVFARYPEIEEVVIYGSRAKGNFRPGSDIDLTLKGPKLDATLLSKLLADLDELNTPYLMDVSIYHQLQAQGLIEHIQAFGQVFYRRN